MSIPAQATHAPAAAALAAAGEPRRLHLPGLNGLRAIVAVAVVISHTGLSLPLFGVGEAWYMALAGYGVTLFFVLSGFLITLLMLLERQSLGRIDIRAFYWRRALRIWPLYYLYLALCLAVAPALGPVIWPLGAWLSALLMPNVAVAIGVTVPFSGHFWSLGVEEQFYLFWPLFMQWALRPGASHESQTEDSGEMAGAVRRATRAIVTFIALFIALKLALGWTMPGSLTYRVVLQARFDRMALGALGACVAFEREGDWQSRLLRLACGAPAQAGAWACVALAAVNKFHIPFMYDPHELDDYLFAVASLILIANASFNPRAWLGRALRWRPIDFLGRISFGIYVYHGLVIPIAATLLGRLPLAPEARRPVAYVVVMAGTVAVAALSYRFYERPFVRLKARWSRVHSSNSA